VRAVELPALGAPEPSADELVASLAAAAAATGAELVILGGSRLSPHAAALRARTAVTVVEPVACAVTMAESLVRVGLRPSKAGKFGRPPRPLAEYQ
jgi:Asp/Glu/hydantoin racemase